MTGPPSGPLRVDREAWLFGLVAVLAAIITLVTAGLLALPVGALAGTIAVAAASAARWAPWFSRRESRRSAAALVAVALVLWAGTQLWPLRSGTRLQTALVAGAAGALAALCFELTFRRGLLSGLVLGCVTVALAAALADGPGLLPGIISGCPASLFALAQLNGVSAGSAAPVATRTGPAAAPVRWFRAVLRWRIVPVLLVVGVSGLSLAGFALAAGGWTGTSGLFGGAAAAGGSSGPAPGRSASAYLSAGALDLRVRGTLDDSPIAVVPGDSPFYWRVGYLDRYTGSNWTQARPGGDRDWRLSPTGPDTVRVTAWDAAEPPAAWLRPARRDTVAPIAGLSDVLAPGRPEMIGSAALGAGGRVVSGPGDHFSLAGPARAGYRVESRPGWDVDDPGTAARLRSARGPDPADPRWTALPAGLPARVRALGRRLAGGTDRRAAVLAVELELRRRIAYRLDSPVPAPGVDAVDDVLFSSRTGFCEQFASAEVVLLRAAGIPARLVTGFAGGSRDRAGRRVLRSADAHAWVEVWFPGSGWAVSDPTAGSTPAPTGRQRMSQLIGLVLAGLRAVPWWLLVAAPLVGAPLVHGARRLLARRFGGRRRERYWSQAAAARAAELAPELLAAFGRLERALAVAGRPRRPGESVAVLADRLLPVQPEATAALGVLERALYARVPPDRSECLRAALALDAAARGLHAASRLPAPAGIP